MRLYDFVLNVVNIIAGILGVLTIISAFFFTSRGLVTRKTLATSSAIFLLFAIFLFLGFSIKKGSIDSGTAIIFILVLILAALVLGIRYLSLPYIRKIVERYHILDKDEKEN